MSISKKKSWADDIFVGKVIPCPVLAGEHVSGEAAGLLDTYQLLGVGLRPIVQVYHPDELTNNVSPTDECFSAEVLSIPREIWSA